VFLKINYSEKSSPSDSFITKDIKEHCKWVLKKIKPKKKGYKQVMSTNTNSLELAVDLLMLLLLF